MKKNELYQMPIEALKYRKTYTVLKFLLIMLFLLPIGAVS